MNNFFKKVKIFFEDIILDIYNKLFSSKYVVKGKCKKCGKCCRNILFSTEEGYVKSKELFNKLRKKYPYYNNYRISGVIKDKDDVQNGALTFECKFISKKNRCLIYPFRPSFCRKYPEIFPEFIYNGLKALDGCGFYFDVNKKFSEYLKDE